MRDVEKIIQLSKTKMKDMLESVLSYNRSFLGNKSQEKLLEKILFAISVIDRRFFYSGREVYDDNALPIGEGQTISQPSTVAKMLLLSELKQGDDVLEVGTGSGWNACLISFLVNPGHVTSVELLAKLKEKAERNLSALRNNLKQEKPEIFQKIEKMNFFAENIFEKGRAWKRKYDKILITAGIEHGQEKKIEFLAGNLLKQKGLLICPYREGPLIIYKKQGKLKKTLTKEKYVFVPLLE